MRTRISQMRFFKCPCGGIGIRARFRSVCLDRHAGSNPVMGTKKGTIIQKKLYRSNMKILLLEPYYTGSHKQWADGYKHYSNNEIRILKMEGKFWKWRMHGGAITLSLIHI